MGTLQIEKENKTEKRFLSAKRATCSEQKFGGIPSLINRVLESAVHVQAN